MRVDDIKLSAAMVADGWKPVVRRAWSAVVSGLDRVRRSFVALVSSPAVWLAVIVVGLGCYWGGHIIGSRGKSDMRAAVASAERARNAANERSEVLALANRQATIDITRLKSEVAALKAAPAPASAPRAAIYRRPVPKVAQVKPAASGAPAASWNPWGR